MKAQQLPHGLYEASIFKLTQELGNQGGDILTRINDDATYRKRVASFMKAGAPDFVLKKEVEPRLTISDAREIMGRHCVICPEVVQRSLGITIDTKQLEEANVIPYRIKTLARCSKTHLLVYGVLKPIKDVLSKIGFNPNSHFSSGCNIDAITCSIPKKGWFLLSRRVQDENLVEGECLATVSDVLYGVLLYRSLKPGCYPFSNISRKEYGRCLETKEGGEVYFGLRMTFTSLPYEKDSHDYNVVWNPEEKVKHTIRVVLPDRVVGDKYLIEHAKDSLAEIKKALTNPEPYTERMVQHRIDCIESDIRGGKFDFDEIGITADELNGLSESVHIILRDKN